MKSFIDEWDNFRLFFLIPPPSTYNSIDFESELFIFIYIFLHLSQSYIYPFYTDLEQLPNLCFPIPISP